MSFRHINLVLPALCSKPAFVFESLGSNLIFEFVGFLAEFVVELLFLLVKVFLGCLQVLNAAVLAVFRRLPLNIGALIFILRMAGHLTQLVGVCPDILLRLVVSLTFEDGVLLALSSAPLVTLHGAAHSLHVLGRVAIATLF